MKSSLMLAAGAAAALGTLPATAQDDAGGLEEITITAQRRAENIQDVPIAVTAVSSEMLESRGISDVAKLSNIAPNVTLDAGTPFSGSDTVLAAYIRGIGQNDFAFNQDPGVGVYVDGVYLARSVGSNTNMLDVERVEILKGPQGTLFGRNTIGGAISIVTREPGSEFMFRGSVTGGSFDRMDVQGTADLPISDRLRTSISFASARRDGYQRRVPFTNLENLDNVPGNPLSLIPDCGAPGAQCAYSTDDSSRFPAAGYRTSDREGGIDQWSVRGKAVFEVSDAVKLTLAADYQNVDQSASPTTVLAIDPVGLAGLYNACLMGFAGPNVPGAPCGPRGGLEPSPTTFQTLPGIAGINVDGDAFNNLLPYDSRFLTDDIDTTYATGNSFSKLENYGVAATLDWAISGTTSLKSITAYRDLYWQTGMDLDGSPLPILEPSFEMPQRELSQELQLSGSLADDRLQYTLGAYYFREEGNLHDWVIFPYGLLMIDGPNDLETRASALFAHIKYRITDRFGITIGARYTDEQKKFEGHQHDTNGLTYKAGVQPSPLLPNGLAPCPVPSAPASSFGITETGTGEPIGNLTCREYFGFPSAEEPYRFYPPGVNRLDFTDTSPVIGFEFHASDDVMIYASYSEGYKTGSWTTRLSSPNPTYNDSLFFDPEEATAYELGMKSEWLDRRLRLNAAAFYTEYEGIQLNSQIGISPTLVNAGDAEIKGIELEAQAVLGGGFSFFGAIGWTDAKYTRLNNVLDNGQLLTLDSCPLRTSRPNEACDLPKTPEYKIYFGPQYTRSLTNGGVLTFNADWTLTDELANDLGNTEFLLRDKTDIVNASITYAAPGDRWELTVGGTNLTDERYVITGQNQGGVAAIYGSYNRPREWFATVRFRFQ